MNHVLFELFLSLASLSATCSQGIINAPKVSEATISHCTFCTKCNIKPSRISTSDSRQVLSCWCNHCRWLELRIARSIWDIQEPTCCPGISGAITSLLDPSPKSPHNARDRNENSNHLQSCPHNACQVPLAGIHNQADSTSSIPNMRVLVVVTLLAQAIAIPGSTQRNSPVNLSGPSYCGVSPSPEKAQSLQTQRQGFVTSYSLPDEPLQVDVNVVVVIDDESLRPPESLIQQQVSMA